MDIENFAITILAQFWLITTNLDKFGFILSEELYIPKQKTFLSKNWLLAIAVLFGQ